MEEDKRSGLEILQAVQGTADDAAVSKVSACQKGYYQDDFIEIFVGKSGKRSPLINRGYYARVRAMEMVTSRFLSAAGENAQVVVLGAGNDTMFFRLKKDGNVPKKYVEVDLKGVVLKKLSVLANHEHIRDLAGVTMDQIEHAAKTVGTAVMQSQDYALACVDLRDVKSLEIVLNQVDGFDFSQPTLFISECVLCYVEPEYSSKLISWMREKFTSVAFTSYEQILPDDAFGRTMLGHFEARGCPLLAIRTYPNLEAQQKRFVDLNWEYVEVYDMNDIYYKCLDKTDLRRAERLEIFDEFEEWHMMQGHYCIVLSVHDESENRVLQSLKLYIPQP